MKYLDERELLSEDQHGFRAGHSCVTQLLEIVEIWTGMLDEGGGIDVVYLDFKKAFDSVPHRRLLKKLEAYGIQGNILKWVESFLTGRKQKVVFNGKSSPWEEVLSGIPQGSVLGPILFIIFINDLPDVVEGQVKIFADDTKLFKAIHSEEDSKQLQKDLNSSCDWSDKWLLRFNVGKCGIMHYGNQEVTHTYTMQEDGVQRNVTETQEEKDLGVLFDPSLKFSKHVGLIASRANRILGVIKRFFDYMDQEMFCILYKTLIRPHLEYANSIWSPLLQKDKELLEKVQRRATKIIPEIKDLPYQDRLETLKIPTLSYRRLRGDLIQVYKILHGVNDVQKEAFFEMSSEETGTRGNSMKIQKKHARLNIRKNSFTHRIVSPWNRLPKRAVCAITVTAFKNEVDDALSAWCNKFTYIVWSGA